MSILDAINDAEAQAADMISEARNASRDMLRSVEANEQVKYDNAMKACRQTCSDKLQQAQAQAKAGMTEALNKEDEANLAFAQDAREKLPTAVSFIVGRILTP
jgi:V/A-type H+-transporting ATPase subunit G/H